jgi:hypothetical protein
MILIEDITRIYKANHNQLPGYYIEFSDGRTIHLTKRRTIASLLILIKYGQGSEADLANGSASLPEIKAILGNKVPDGLISDYYGDANKPYSELWNEEGFSFIDNLKGSRIARSQGYVLRPEDHDKLFTVAKKANRVAPSSAQQLAMVLSQNSRCNLCGSLILSKAHLKTTSYWKDRRRLVFDHRFPVEKGGPSGLENFQGLCFACNKAKWQICNICTIPGCDMSCALRNPEISKTIAPTQENIADLLADRVLFERPQNVKPN